MIFGLGATVLENIFGRWLRPFVLPVLCVALLTLAKVAWDKRDARLMKEGERICDAKWEGEIRKQERQQVEADFRAGRRILEIERNVDEGLTNDLSALQSSIDLLRTDSTSNNCLSDGVLDLLGKEPGASTAPAKQGRKPTS